MSIETNLREGSQAIKQATRDAQYTSKSPAQRQRRFNGPVLPVVAGLAIVALISVPTVLVGIGSQPSVFGDPEASSSPPGATPNTDSSPTAPSTVDLIAESGDSTLTVPDAPTNGGPTAVRVSILSANDPSAPNWPNDSERVEEILSITGITYTAYPDVPRDAAVRNGRAVIAAGNTDRIAGLWYSDDGTWNRATISLPAGINIGETDGDYRLADGIQNVEAFSGGFAAWEPVQLVAGSEADFAGTLLLVSIDGKEWKGAIYGEPNASFTDFGEYRDGYVATLSLREDDTYKTKLLWSQDLWGESPIDWDSLTTVGDGYPYELVVEGSSVYILLASHESNDGAGVNVAKVELD